MTTVIPGVYVYTNPGSHRIEGAGWDHVALGVWADAVVAWDRDYPTLIINSIHVYNGERHSSLWVGLDTAVDVLYGRTSGVVNWCRQHRRWELVQSHTDHQMTEARVWWFRVERDKYERERRC